MNGHNRGNSGRSNPKRRGYNVPALSHHDAKRSRHVAAPPRRVEDTDYYGPSSSSRSRGGSVSSLADKAYDDPGMERAHALKGWNCAECQTWNHEKEAQCQQCGLFASSSASDTKEENEDDLDEFGRRRPPPGPPVAPSWPPQFEKHGSEYVLDNRSGMFYESKSKFFYDPTTKMYYSHEKQGYFRHRLTETGKSVFDKVENETTVAAESASSSTTTSTDKQMMVPAISINLKTKALPKKPKKKKEDSTTVTVSSSNSKESNATAPANRKTKEHEADLAKWSERLSEQKTVDRDLSKIPKTAKGEPICSLCQRKFPTLDKLFYHERVSELHKSNLAKRAAAQEIPTPQPAKTEACAYVDRAEQRRLLHGPENTNLVSGGASSVDQSISTERTTTTVVDPKETLNETNIGNKMLQKLGWQQGKGLGRRTAEASNELQQDWERIERLAASNGSGRK